MAAPELHIFPTSSRSKHSKEVSYPIGAEALSQALEGVPQHDRIVCDFYGGRPHDDGKPQIYVLNARYEKQARRFSDSGSALERGVFDPRWTISIFAVPRQLRGEIKLLLLEQGLPEIVRPWFITKSHLLESMPMLPWDTSPSELYVRLSPHTAPSLYLLGQY
jgi:hypothetical protein